MLKGNFVFMPVLFFILSFGLRSEEYSNGHSGFIENKGQFIDQHGNSNKEVCYLFQGNGINIQLRKNGFSYDCFVEVASQRTKFPSSGVMGNRGQRGQSMTADSMSFDIKFHRIDVELVGSNPNATFMAYDQEPGYENFYTTATGEKGATMVRRFGKIIYKNVYPSIDLEFIEDSAKKVKYNFIIHPGGNIENIRMAYTGANKLEMKNDAIKIETALGTVEENIPYSFLSRNGKRERINVTYEQQGNVFGFKTDSYDKSAQLVIDPNPDIGWGTYFGGNKVDFSQRIAIDNNKNIAITGYTKSSSNIATAGSHQSIYSANFDAFIAKFDIAGTLLWSTYYGGIADDLAYGIAADINDNIIIGGYTLSDNMATAGAFNTTNPLLADGFIAKFNSSGTRQWSTYYGTGMTWVLGVDADNNGNIVVSGRTWSAGGIGTAGTFQPNYGGGVGTSDGFAAKFDPAGARLWGSYFGGTNDDLSFSVTTDKSGNVIAAAQMNSPGMASTNAYETTCVNCAKMFIIKFNPSGNRMWSTYYGGNDYYPWGGLDIATDKEENILSCCNIWFAVTSLDACILKFDASGNFKWANYYGSPDKVDGAMGIATDSSMNVVVVGQTNSSTGIATSGAYKQIYDTGYEAFIVKFNPAGTRLWGTYYGSGADGADVETYSDECIALTGVTSGTTGISTPGAWQEALNGTESDAFVATFCDNFTPPVARFAASDTIICENECILFADSSLNDPVTWEWSFPGAVTASSSLQYPNVCYMASGTYDVQLIVTNPAGSDTLKKTPFILVKSSPAADAGKDTSVCEGGSITIGGAPTASGGTSPYSHTWSPSTGLNVTSSPNPLASPAYTLTYTLTVTDANNCRNTDSMLLTLVIVKANPAGDTSLCKGDSTVLSSDPATSYFWVPSTGLSCTNCQSPVAGCQFSTIYTLVVSEGLCSDNASISIAVYDVRAQARPDTAVCHGDSIYLGGSPVAWGGLVPYSYSWSGSAIVNKAVSNALAFPSVSTNYTLSVNDINNCRATDTVYITVNDCEYVLYVPNSFTPNGDGINDVFKLEGENVEITNWRIFNRWGEILFEAPLSTGRGAGGEATWDGIFNKNPVQEGVYIFAVNALSKDGKNISQKGRVTLIR